MAAEVGWAVVRETLLVRDSDLRQEIVTRWELGGGPSQMRDKVIKQNSVPLHLAVWVGCLGLTQLLMLNARDRDSRKLTQEWGMFSNCSYSGETPPLVTVCT